MTKAFDVRSELFSQINKASDDSKRNMLLLLLGILDEITSKLDEALSSSEIRKAALNGHEANHHEHHDWIEKHLESDCDAVCAWAREKMLAEKDEAVSERETKRAARKEAILSAIGGAMWVTAAGLAAFVSTLLAGRLTL